MTNNIKNLTNEELYTKYNKHVEKYCRITQNKYHWVITIDEAIQVGWVGLIKMMQNYQPLENSTEADFLFLSSIRVSGAVKDEVRRLSGVKKSGDKVSYNIRKFETYIEELSETQALPRSLYSIDPEMPSRSVNDMLGVLKDQQQIMVLRLYYTYDKTYSEIADISSVNVGRISQIHKAAIAKLRWYEKVNKHAA